MQSKKNTIYPICQRGGSYIQKRMFLSAVDNPLWGKINEQKKAVTCCIDVFN